MKSGSSMIQNMKTMNSISSKFEYTNRIVIFSDNEKTVAKRRVASGSEQSSDENSVEDRARSPSDSDEGVEKEPPVKTVKKKRIVSSDEESKDGEVGGDGGGEDDDGEGGFAIADDD